MPLFNPPLLNSSNPWATSVSDLQDLYNCPSTGAVTTRTNTLNGFAHNDTIHQYCFFNSHTLSCLQKEGDCANSSSSLNTLGYSPIPLADTIENVKTVVQEAAGKHGSKAFILSVTGSPAELKQCYHLIAKLQTEIPQTPLYMEVNLSCPNITGKPPPAYDLEALKEYLATLVTARAAYVNDGTVPIGIKTPPYSNPENFVIVKNALMSCVSSTASEPPIAFITATNTLGCSLVLADLDTPALGSVDGLGIGGMAGSALHPLSLGNVKLLRRMLDSDPYLERIKLIGIGGVGDGAGFQRMKSVGADVVGVGTALGRKGVSIFEEILRESKYESS